MISFVRASIPILGITLFMSAAFADTLRFADWEVKTMPDENFQRLADQGIVEIQFMASTPLILSNGKPSSIGSWMIACRKQNGRNWELIVSGLGTEKSPSFDLVFDDQNRIEVNYSTGEVSQTDLLPVIKQMILSSSMSIPHSSGRKGVSLRGVTAALKEVIDSCPADSVKHVKYELGW